jgi:hypothetical protein
MKEMLLHKIYPSIRTKIITFWVDLHGDKTVHPWARSTMQVKTELNSKNSLTIQVNRLAGLILLS